MFEFLATTSPWVYLSIGIILFVIDISQTQTEYLLWIGVSVAYLAPLQYFGLDGNLLATFFSLGLFLNLRFLRKWLLLSSKSQDIHAITENIVGLTGTISVVSDSDQSKGKVSITGKGEWRVVCNTGQTLSTGDSVLVDAREGNCLTVSLVTNNK